MHWPLFLLFFCLAFLLIDLLSLLAFLGSCLVSLCPLAVWHLQAVWGVPWTPYYWFVPLEHHNYLCFLFCLTFWLLLASELTDLVLFLLVHYELFFYCILGLFVVGTYLVSCVGTWYLRYIVLSFKATYSDSIGTRCIFVLSLVICLCMLPIYYSRQAIFIFFYFFILDHIDIGTLFICNQFLIFPWFMSCAYICSYDLVFALWILFVYSYCVLLPRFTV